MTDKKITDESAAGALSGADVLGLIQSGADTQTTLTAIAAYVNGLLGTASTKAADTDGTLAANSDANVPSQKAVKTYITQTVNARKFKGEPARAKTTAALAANTYANGTAGVGATLTGNANGALAAQDGITLVANECLLVANEATGANNGLYIVTQVGDGSNPYILTRRADADESTELVNATVYVSDGTAAGDQQWTCTTNAPITVGTTALTWAQTGAGTTFTGGTLSSALNEAPAVTVASSTTPAIFAAAGNTINMTGTTTVTGFDTIAAGAVRRVIFGGILQLTYNATSMQNLTSANITTAAGDVAEFESLGSGNTKMLSYTRASGTALVGGGSSTFAGLTDGPGALTGNAFSVPRVNAAGTALEYVKTEDQPPDPAHLWYGPSGNTVELFTSQSGGDPCVVWDGAQWVMIYWRTVSGSPYVKCYYRTAPTLEGTWSSATEITSLASYHKPFILMDELGVPVIIGGNYHAYAVYFGTGTITDKEIFHFTASSLTGTWTLASKVIAKGSSGAKDEYTTDTPFALYRGGTIYLWYMGAPTTSVADYGTYGYAIRMLRATATVPDGPFTKSSSDVLTPSTSAAWDYGWLGGVQVRLRIGGGYMMVYNAGDTRPSTVGTEPNTSRIGYAYADSIDGPWTKDAANPYMKPDGWPANGPDATNAWRGYIQYDKVLGSWYMFYNTNASSSGGERITWGRAGVYDYFDTTGGNPYIILTVTTSIQTITNSKVNVTPGIYRVRYVYNVGDLGTTKPAIDISVSMRLNGTTIHDRSTEFVGSYNYENRDCVIEYIVAVNASGYFDACVQCTNGTPTANSQIRRGRVTVERIRAA